jgi:hypothetical protein
MLVMTSLIPEKLQFGDFTGEQGAEGLGLRILFFTLGLEIFQVLFGYIPIFFFGGGSNNLG